ncbi:MAG: hypothetical protein Kow0010_11490 [Dehalococcoidia bacterium]
MPTQYGTRRQDAAASVRIAPSAACELEFVFFVVRTHGSWHRPDPPWLAPFIEEHGELYRRIRDFWGEDRSPECAELLVLAERADVLFGEDGARVVDALEAAATSARPLPALRTETQVTRDLLRARLMQLATSPETRLDYVQLARDTWEAMSDEWRVRGLPAVLARCNAWQEQVERGAPPLQVLPSTSMARQQRLGTVAVAGLVQEALEQGRLAFVPTYFAGEGRGLLELSDWLLVAEGIDSGREMERRREKAAEAARRFKVLSDPTRLAILTFLMTHGTSVRDLAETFELTQPTVSVHVKALREAGLLESQKAGNLTLYRASAEHARAWVAEAVEAMLAPTCTCGTCPWCSG